MIYSERDLIMPALNYLLLNKEDGLTTSQLIQLLSKDLEISGKDLEILQGRSDNHFSQKVRNLLSSHNILNNYNLATREDIGGNSLHRITNKGEKYLIENVNNFTFILDNNFSEEQRKDVIEQNYLNLIIEEGYTTLSHIKTKKRSRKLVLAAKQYYSRNDRIYCSACNFNFEEFYGEVGEGYIEIHHLNPIFAQEENFEQSIQEALPGVAPVCANCHRIIHRKRDQLLSISSLQELININGIYQAQG